MAGVRSPQCSPLDDGPRFTRSPTEVESAAQGGRRVPASHLPPVNSTDQQELDFSPTRLLSCHQTPQGEFPPPPSLWMPRLLPPRPVPPWILPRPSARSAQRSAFEEGDEERSSRNKTDDGGVDDPTHFLNYYRRRSSLAPPIWSRSAHLDPRWDPLKWKRLQDLAQSMNSPVEDQQYYAAQALGCLGVSETFVLDALWTAVSLDGAPQDPLLFLPTLPASEPWEGAPSLLISDSDSPPTSKPYQRSIYSKRPPFLPLPSASP